jgi:hypothetical protein
MSQRQNETKATMVAFGGGSGGYAHKEIKVTEGDNYSVVVGGPGQTSSFGTEVSATGAKTFIERKYCTDTKYRDHSSCTGAPCHFCFCNNALGQCLEDILSANTTNPELVTGNTYIPGSGRCCDTTLCMKGMKATANFIENVYSVPGEGVGGDVNKTGSCGYLHEYTIDVPPETAGRFMFTINYAQCMNSAISSYGQGYFSETACICGHCGIGGCIKDTLFCAPSDTSGCCVCQCCQFNNPMTYCNPAEPGLAFNDTKIRGSIAPTENYSANVYEDSVCAISYYAAPYNCQEGYKRKYGLKGVTDSSKLCVAGAGLWACVLHSACTYGGACTSHQYNQDRPLYYIPTCDEGLQKLYYDWVRFKPHRELFEIAFCCDDLTYEERMVSEDIHDRIQSNCMFYCLSTMLTCSSGNTELNVLGEGDDKVLVPNYMVWDNEYRYATCSAQSRNNRQAFGGDINTSDLVSNGIATDTDEATKIISNTRNRYFGNWEKLLTDGTHTWCAVCTDGTSARPGFDETSGDFVCYYKVPFCLRREYYCARTSSSTVSCSNYTWYDGVPNSNNCTLGACSACMECVAKGQGGIVEGGDMAGCFSGHVCSSMTYPVVKHSRAFTDFRPTLDTSCNICILEKGAMRSGHMGVGANFGCCSTIFFSPKVEYKQSPGIDDECYKECYKNAGQGGYSSWYKDCAKGRSGLVVVCY